MGTCAWYPHALPPSPPEKKSRAFSLDMLTLIPEDKHERGYLALGRYIFGELRRPPGGGAPSDSCVDCTHIWHRFVACLVRAPIGGGARRRSAAHHHTDVTVKLDMAEVGAFATFNL